MPDLLPERLRPGARSEWTREVTEDDVVRFAELSGDKGRHHLERDDDGRLMAHGLLTATLPTKLGGDLNFMARSMTFEFEKPVFSGDRLTCRGVVERTVEQSSRYKISLAFEVLNQEGVMVLKGTSSGQIAKPRSIDKSVG